MEDREFSSPVCYLDFDRDPPHPTTAPHPDIPEARDHGESGGAPAAAAAKPFVRAPPGPPADASAARPTAAPAAAPPCRSPVACAGDDSSPVGKGTPLAVAAPAPATCEKAGGRE